MIDTALQQAVESDAEALRDLGGRRALARGVEADVRPEVAVQVIDHLVAEPEAVRDQRGADLLAALADVG